MRHAMCFLMTRVTNRSGESTYKRRTTSGTVITEGRTSRQCQHSKMTNMVTNRIVDVISIKHFLNSWIFQKSISAVKSCHHMSPLSWKHRPQCQCKMSVISSGKGGRHTRLSGTGRGGWGPGHCQMCLESGCGPLEQLVPTGASCGSSKCRYLETRRREKHWHYVASSLSDVNVWVYLSCFF